MDSSIPLICVIDDDPEIRGSLESFLRSYGYRVLTFSTPLEFLACDETDAGACLLLDVQLGNSDGLDFQQELLDSHVAIPVILISGHGDVPRTVRAMKAGAVTFLSKPIDSDALLAALIEALALDEQRRSHDQEAQELRGLFEKLTTREREVMGLVTAGLMNKQVAGRLELSEITVKIHRGNVMRKMKAQSLADLVRMAEELGAREESVARFNAAQG